MTRKAPNQLAAPPTESPDLYALMATAARLRNAPFLNHKASDKLAAEPASSPRVNQSEAPTVRRPCEPSVTAHPAFADMMATAQQDCATPQVDYEASVRRAALTPPEKPAVKLPDRRSCLACPYKHRRQPAYTPGPCPTVFEEFVRSGDAQITCVTTPPKTFAGVDVGHGPHAPVRPGYEDLARIVDPAVLADALYYNLVLPACPCTEALFAAADADFYAGVRLDFLRQELVLRRRRVGSTESLAAKPRHRCPAPSVA